MAGYQGANQNYANDPNKSFATVARKGKDKNPKSKRKLQQEGAETPYFKSYTRPRSFGLTARDTGTGLKPFEKEMIDDDTVHYIDSVQEIGRAGYWIVTCSSSEIKDLLLLKYADTTLYSSTELRENMRKSIRLYGVPNEYHNDNIVEYLKPYFLNPMVKKVPMRESIFTSNCREIQFDRLLNKPPEKVRLGSGIYGYLQGNLCGPLEYVHTKCTNCSMEGHLAETCTNATQCGQCSRMGHITSNCTFGKCVVCQAPNHMGKPCDIVCGFCQGAHLNKKCKQKDGRCHKCCVKHAKGKCPSPNTQNEFGQQVNDHDGALTSHNDDETGAQYTGDSSSSTHDSDIESDEDEELMNLDDNDSPRGSSRGNRLERDEQDLARDHEKVLARLDNFMEEERE